MFLNVSGTWPVIFSSEGRKNMKKPCSYYQHVLCANYIGFVYCCPSLRPGTHRGLLEEAGWRRARRGGGGGMRVGASAGQILVKG
jgi:hypothetical protein